MAIRFDKDFNQEIYSTVRNYNARFKRMQERGVTRLPNRASVKELKSRYSNRKDLIKELKRLKTLGRKQVEDVITIRSGAKVREWEMDYIKVNKEGAKKYFQSEYDRISKRIGKFPGERTYLDTVSAKINLLEKNMENLEDSEIRSLKSTINEFAEAPTIQSLRYRGFLSEVDWVMDKTGYSQDQRNAFFKKFSKLTPTQFLYAYDNNDIIARIYNLYHKDYDEEEAHLTTTEEDATNAINELIAQTDTIILDAQLNSD